MARKTQNMNLAAAFNATLRGIAIAGLAGGMIALAGAPAVHADSATSVQKASIPAAKGNASEISREYLIKSAILYNFAKFASWPEAAFTTPGAPLRVCVLGDDPFGAALDTLNGKQVRDRSLATARITDIHDAPQCHMVFVSTSETPRLTEILEYLGQHPILTVADINRFAAFGGIIALKEVDNRSRIEVNMDAADRAGLKLSSKLLRLADMADTASNTGNASNRIGTDTATLPVDADRSAKADTEL